MSSMLSALQSAFERAGLEVPETSSRRQPDSIERVLVTLVPGEQACIAFDLRKDEIPEGVQVVPVSGGRVRVRTDERPYIKLLAKLELESFLEVCSVLGMSVVRNPDGSHRLYVNYEDNPEQPGLNYWDNVYGELFKKVAAETWIQCSIREKDKVFNKTMVVFGQGRAGNVPPQVKIGFKMA